MTRPNAPTQPTGAEINWGDIAQVGAPILAGGVSAYSQWRANLSNERIAQENRAFQERMSSTSWQRAVEDMKLAGINPALAYMKGGASSPGGATATMQSVAGQSAASAMGAIRLKKEMKLMDQQIALTDETIKKTQQDAGRSFSESQYIKTQNRVLGAGPRTGRRGANGVWETTPWAVMYNEQNYNRAAAEAALAQYKRPFGKIGSKQWIAWINTILGRNPAATANQMRKR